MTPLHTIRYNHFKKLGAKG